MQKWKIGILFKAYHCKYIELNLALERLWNAKCRWISKIWDIIVIEPSKICFIKLRTARISGDTLTSYLGDWHIPYIPSRPLWSAGLFILQVPNISEVCSTINSVKGFQGGWPIQWNSISVERWQVHSALSGNIWIYFCSNRLSQLYKWVCAMGVYFVLHCFVFTIFVFCELFKKSFHFILQCILQYISFCNKNYCKPVDYLSIIHP